jgi:hypothetical protein
MCRLSKKSHIRFPEIPGRFSREAKNAKKAIFPGKRERKIPVIKALSLGHLFLGSSSAFFSPIRFT